MMPTIYARWSLGICHRFGNNLSKMCLSADFNGPKLDICTNLHLKALRCRANILGGSGAPT